jgi:hypothetical protein
VTFAVTAAAVADNLRELETWYLRACELDDAENWETFRTGEKTRGTQTKARLTA